MIGGNWWFVVDGCCSVIADSWSVTDASWLVVDGQWVVVGAWCLVFHGGWRLIVFCRLLWLVVGGWSMFCV